MLHMSCPTSRPADIKGIVPKSVINRAMLSMAATFFDRFNKLVTTPVAPSSSHHT